MKKMFLSFVCVLFISGCALLNNTTNDRLNLYLDYAASDSIDENALDTFNKVSRMDGNSSGINSHAKKLKLIEEQSAQIIAHKIGATDINDILFVQNASIANNIAILGVAYKNPHCHLITSKIEHKSVLNTFKHLETLGYQVTYLDVDKFGIVDINELKNSIQNNTRLISIQALNSEIGSVQNLKKIGLLAKQREILFHTDAAQAFCKLPINVNECSIDFMTISGYKIGAPKGIAALYISNKDALSPIMFGSGDKLYPGTKSTALIASFAKAVQHFNYNKEKIAVKFKILVDGLSKLHGFHINTSVLHMNHIVSVSIEGVLLKDVLREMKHYSFSAGCSCSGQEQSNVIESIDHDKKLPSCTLRISFSHKVSDEYLTQFVRDLDVAVNKLRKLKNISGKNCEKSGHESGKELKNVLLEIENSLAKNN